MTARTVVEMAEHFSSAPFAPVRDVIESNGGSWSISSVGDGEFVAPPVGGEATIIVQGRTPDRRFGLVVVTGGWALRGLRGKKFRIDDLRDEVQNEDFMAELRRRLGCAGATREEILDAPQNTALSHWKANKRRGQRRVAAWHSAAF